MPDDSILPAASLIRSNTKSSGFSLVIALSLMAFVLVLLLVIITFVKVETRSSEMTLQGLLAQNNALLGMQVALGELQVAAGPDQRITANAAILDEVHATKANYTLVWDSQLTPGQVRVTWEQLQSFYQLGYERSGDTITARAQEADSHGVYPLLVMLHMNFGFTVENNYAAGTPSDPADRNYQIYGHMRPWFVLANPYNTELSVSNYRIRFNQYSAARLQVSYQQSGVGVTDLIDESMDDYLKNLVFVVPEVTLTRRSTVFYLGYHGSCQLRL